MNIIYFLIRHIRRLRLILLYGLCRLLGDSQTNILVLKQLDYEYNEISDLMLYGIFSLIESHAENVFEHEGITADTLEIDYEDDLAYCDNEDEIIGIKNKYKSLRSFFELYRWWVEVRPARRDPFDNIITPLLNMDYTGADKKDGGLLDFAPTVTAKEKRKFKEDMKKAWALEKKYSDEDTKMMYEAIKMRDYLWY